MCLISSNKTCDEQLEKLKASNDDKMIRKRLVKFAEEANIYAYHLTQAHAFIDGNKRIAAAVSEIFLEINEVKLNATNEQIVDLFLGIASGEKSRNDVEQIFLQWIS